MLLACVLIYQLGLILKKDSQSFHSFLNQLPSLDLWERGIDGNVFNFSNIGGYIFLSIGKILVHYFQIGKFTGDLIGRIEIRNNLTVSFTSPVIEENDYISSKYGLKIDILHFRHMIAQVILKSLGQDFEQKLSVSFKLFFSELFLYHKDLYVLQYCHPIFFNPSERLSFIHLILDSTGENPGARWIGDHFYNEKYSFHDWQ
ncbi:hypothetical protein SO802_028270 [Lithocarpus litseifolius]|uniref:Uncharacterized protein n=1 Tax=Lithocarpus litseifolius TaxID=425828 RepID=A0AAW2BRW7_9ROSI